MKANSPGELNSPFTPVRPGDGNGRTPGGDIAVPMTPVREGVSTGMDRDHGVETGSPAEESPRVLGEHGRDAENNYGHYTYDVIKGLDVSFGIDVSRLENEARAFAVEWAEKGLPRHDLAPDEPLEVEKILATRCIQIFSEWVRKVRTRMEDTIERDVQDLGRKVLALRQCVDRIRDTREQLVSALMTGKQEVQNPSRPRAIWRLSFPSEMTARVFWPLMGLLVLADFVANVPVFAELLPGSDVAERTLKRWETEASASLGSFALRLFARMLVYPEATVLAFAVILFLVVLAHAVGASLRSLIALRGTRPDIDEPEIREVRNRPRAPAIMAAAGVACTLVVLFAARAKIEPIARERLTVAQIRVDSLSLALGSATTKGSANSVAELTRARADAKDILASRLERHDYARAIGDMNWPVLGLNFVLVLAAMVTAYQRRSADLAIGESPKPEITGPSDARASRISALRTSLREQREAVGMIASDIETAIGKVYHLMRARPLLEWRGKAERLSGVVPLFRAENARIRAMDTRSILAFTVEPKLGFPAIDPTAPFSEPRALAVHTSEYAGLQSDLNQLQSPILAEEYQESRV